MVGIGALIGGLGSVVGGLFAKNAQKEQAKVEGKNALQLAKYQAQSYLDSSKQLMDVSNVYRRGEAEQAYGFDLGRMQRQGDIERENIRSQMADQQRYDLEKSGVQQRYDLEKMGVDYGWQEKFKGQDYNYARGLAQQGYEWQEKAKGLDYGYSRGLAQQGIDWQREAKGLDYGYARGLADQEYGWRQRLQGQAEGFELKKQGRQFQQERDILNLNSALGIANKEDDRRAATRLYNSFNRFRQR